MDAPIQGYPDNLRAQTVTIASGAAASEMIATQGMALVGVIMPAAWTAADLAFKGCISGRDLDMLQVYDNAGNPEKSKAAASQFIVFPSADAIFTPFLQVLSVSTADDTTGVNQEAARTLTLLFRKYLS